MPDKEDWLSQFNQIDSLLTATKQYWQIAPFEYKEIPWLCNTKLHSQLLALTDDEVDNLEACDKSLQQFISPLIGINLDFLAPLELKIGDVTPVSPHFKAGIKGRKWQQISYFESLLPKSIPSLLEWCAGKGHLGRLVSLNQNIPVTSLEWQSELCRHGEVLAKKHGVNQNFIEADAFNINLESLLKPSQHVIALHACGSLHMTLLQQAKSANVEGLSIAPCCYHLIKNTVYEPISSAVQKSKLRLSRQDLSLAMQKTVVATKREKKHREIEVSWRLGFDLLQRDLRSKDEYLPLPSIAQSMLSGSFENFCHWACKVKKLTLKPDVVLLGYEMRGKKRQRDNKKIELVTHAFRQLLERWLLLDRVLLMVESNYDVSLFNFCDTQVTPRNAMIQAIKKPT